MQRRSYNPKRQIAPAGSSANSQLSKLRDSATYKGSPYHKRNPGDYGLQPPASPKPGKTLCDAKGSILKQEAQDLLQSGFDKGMVSSQRRGEWPQNVWAVSEDGTPYEAELENQVLGEYHGYPMPKEDPFRKEVIDEWESR